LEAQMEAEMIARTERDAKRKE